MGDRNVFRPIPEAAIAMGLAPPALSNPFAPDATNPFASGPSGASGRTRFGRGAKSAGGAKSAAGGEKSPGDTNYEPVEISFEEEDPSFKSPPRPRPRRRLALAPETSKSEPAAAPETFERQRRPYGGASSQSSPPPRSFRSLLPSRRQCRRSASPNASPTPGSRRRQGGVANNAPVEGNVIVGTWTRGTGRNAVVAGFDRRGYIYFRIIANDLAGNTVDGSIRTAVSFGDIQLLDVFVGCRNHYELREFVLQILRADARNANRRQG